MVSNSFSEPVIELTKETKDYMVYPPRTSTHIEDRDWNRWVRKISNLPKQKTIYKDIAHTSIGIAIPSLISAYATNSSETGLPQWVWIVYLVIGTIALVTSILCFVFTRQLDQLESSTVDDILLDMNEVHDKAVHSEERVIVKENG